MSNTSLHRFGIDPDGDPAAQWAKMCQLVGALVNNPFLHVGACASTLALPTAAAASVPQQVASPAASVGAFWGLLRDDGDTFLQGGTVTAGDMTVTVDDIKVIDASTGPEAAAGRHLYLECTGNGVVTDDVLIPGWNLTAVVDPVAHAATVPSNTMPTAALPNAKKVFISLGVFTAGGFAPAGSGNIEISFCPSAYSVTRS